MEGNFDSPGDVPEMSTYVHYEAPAPSLLPFIADYHVLDSSGPAARNATETMLPNAASIRIILARSAMSLTTRVGRFDPLPVAALYGPTTQVAYWSVENGGKSLGINLTAAGFARLFDTDASQLRDRVVPLEEFIPATGVSALVDRLRALPDDAAVAPVLDQWFTPLLAAPHRHEKLIAKISALLIDPDVVSMTAAASSIGIAPHRLARLTARHFGHPPKGLLMRTRLLRSILALKAAGRFDLALIDPAYHDQSHFNRDAQRFLGTSATQFLRTPTPFLDAVLRARAASRGSALAALDEAPA